jgi:hypothetical protein
VCIDVTVTSPLQTAFLRSSDVRPGAAAAEAEEAKVRKNKPLSDARGLLFVPIAIETLGGFGALAGPTIERLCRRKASKVGSDFAFELRSLHERISVALQRANAGMAIRRGV